MSRSAAASPSLPPPVGELLALFGRLEGVTERALAAARDGEGDALAPLVEQRETVLSLIAPLLQEMHLLGQRSDGVPRVALEAVVEAGRRLEGQDRELAATLSRSRERVSAELKRMGRAAAARTAYSRGPSRRPGGGR